MKPVKTPACTREHAAIHWRRFCPVFTGENPNARSNTPVILICHIFVTYLSGDWGHSRIAGWGGSIQGAVDLHIKKAFFDV
jgi:hypothetical protein